MKLRAIEKKDLEIIRKWRNESMESLRTPYFLTEKMQSDFYDNQLSNRSFNGMLYAIQAHTYCEETEELVGYGGLNPISWENRIGEIALLIGTEYQKSKFKYGQRAIELILEEGFKNLNLKTIYGEHYMGENKYFWEKIIKKYNFTTARLPNKKFHNGRYLDSIYFSLDRDNYKC